MSFEVWALAEPSTLQHKLQTYLGSPVPKKDQFFDWPGELRVEIKGGRLSWAITNDEHLYRWHGTRPLATFTNPFGSHANVPSLFEQPRIVPANPVGNPDFQLNRKRQQTARPGTVHDYTRSRATSRVPWLYRPISVDVWNNCACDVTVAFTPYICSGDAAFFKWGRNWGELVGFMEVL